MLSQELHSTSLDKVLELIKIVFKEKILKLQYTPCNVEPQIIQDYTGTNVIELIKVAFQETNIEVIVDTLYVGPRSHKQLY